MKKLLINALAAIFVLSAPATMAQAQQPMTEGMKDMRMDKTAAGQTVHATRGKVTRIDADASVVILAHEPVGSLDWPAMTMGFKVTDRKLMDKLIVGKTVDFEFIQADKGYVITGVK